MTNVYRVLSSQIPATGTPGDLWYATDTAQAFFVLGNGSVTEIANLLAGGTEPGPAGPPGPAGMTREQVTALSVALSW